MQKLLWNHACYSIVQKPVTKVQLQEHISQNPSMVTILADIHNQNSEFAEFLKHIE